MKNIYALISVALYFLILFISSCKKHHSKNHYDGICITIKDSSTNQVVEGVSISLSEDQSSQSAGYVNYGNTDATGIACIDLGYRFIDAISVDKPGYEPCCYFSNPAATFSTFEVLLLKRNSFIQLHLVNRAPV